MKHLLVTGGAGFIGSNFIKRMLEIGLYAITNLDALTYAGNLHNLSVVSNHQHYSFVKGNVCDRPLLKQLFSERQFDAVIHFAAESHVDRSIESPQIFLETNILGTQTLLDAALSQWKLDVADKYSRSYKPGVRFIQVSTDEVYGTLKDEGYFTELMPILPNSPYSASKASADMIVRAYFETYGLPVNITRCSNNYGPYQFPEKLIPLMINNCIQNKALPIYGDGMQIRDWLHVWDHCDAIRTVLEKGVPGEIYNIGGNNEKTNLQIVELIIRELGKSTQLIRHVKDRPGHDRRYAIDNTKITTQLGWSPSFTFEQGISETIRWYMDHAQWLEEVISGEYMEYYKRMYR